MSRRTPRTRPAALLPAALSLALLPLPAPAQAPAPSAVPPRVITQTASTNPLAAPFGFVSGEYERALGRRGFALGVGGLTSFGADPQAPNDGGSESFRSAQVKLKYYPRQEGLRGLAVGLTAGVAFERQLVWATYQYGPDGALVASREETASRTAPTIGTTLDYNFLVGRQRRFLVGLGVGARRALGVGDRYGPLHGALIDPRLQLGFGF